MIGILGTIYIPTQDIIPGSWAVVPADSIRHESQSYLLGLRFLDKCPFFSLSLGWITSLFDATIFWRYPITISLAILVVRSLGLQEGGMQKYLSIGSQPKSRRLFRLSAKECPHSSPVALISANMRTVHYPGSCACNTLQTKDSSPLRATAMSRRAGVRSKGILHHTGNSSPSRRPCLPTGGGSLGSPVHRMREGAHAPGNET